MDPIALILTIAGIIIAIIIGYLQIIVPFTKKEVKFSRRFPFVISTTEVGAIRIDTEDYAKIIAEEFPIPKERRPIAVMPFKNLTGDTSYDYLSEAIPNLLITNLEQSKHLSVMTWERMYDLLEILGKEEVKVIDDKLGFEVCKLDGVNNIVLGSFTKAGEMFATDLKVLNVSTKQLLKTANSKAKGIDSILESQIDALSKDIHLGVGLSGSKTEETRFHIADVTTDSMEAYSYFLKGKEAFEKFYHESARELLEKAINIDPTFAMAHFYLALVNRYAGNRKIFSELFAKALQLSKNVTEKERLWVESRYAFEIENDVEKQISILKILLSKYPKAKNVHLWLGIAYRTKNMLNEAIEEYKKELLLNPKDGEPWNYLAYDYTDLGHYAEAVESIEKFKQADPDNANSYDSAGDIYFQIGHLDKSIDNFKSALEVEPKMYRTNLKLAYVCAFQENYAQTKELLQKEEKKVTFAGSRARIYWWHGLYYLWLGRCNQSFEHLSRAEELYKSVENIRDLSCVDLMRAWICFEKKEFQLCLSYFQNFLEIRTEVVPEHQYFHNAYYYFWLGLLDVEEDHVKLARQKIDKMKEFTLKIRDPMDKGELDYQCNLLEVEIQIVEGLVKNSIDIEKDIPFRFRKTYLVMQSEFFALRYILPCQKDLTARAYIAKKETDKAIVEYERLITFDPTSKDRRLIHPKYHYRLAKLYEEKGLKVKAIEQYEKFLDIWRDADEDLPEPHDARKCLARLKTI